MPNNMDYSQGKIYTIRCRDDDTLVYVGSTIQPLPKRWGGHKGMSTIHPNRPLYSTINNEWDKWYIELFELYPCNSKMELLKREGEIIREIGTLNKRVAGRDMTQYFKDNADKFKQYQKKYTEQNIDKIKEYYKQYYQTDESKEKKKQYYHQNADKRKEYQKRYYQQKTEKCITTEQE